MNFIGEYNKGQKGENKGIPLGPGLMAITKAINGLQQRKIYVCAAGPKVGKSTLVDNGWVIHPCLYALKHKIPIEIIYLSYEIDRVSKEFDFCAFFLAYDFKIKTIVLPEGVLVKGKKEIELNSDYLRGRLQDDKEEIILMDPEIKKLVITIYEKRLKALFGSYSTKGVKIKSGLITFIEERSNPTGINIYLLAHAELNGKLEKEEYAPKQYRITGYTPKNPKKITLVVCDHLRKIKTEKGFSLKQVIDKYSEYSVGIRNLTGYSFMHIIHLSRALGETENKKFMSTQIHPNADHIKDSGNLSEDADYVFTMFNPNDPKYNLTKHFNLDIRDSKNNLVYPKLRTIHLVESRHCFFPQHFQVNMLGNIKQFENIIKK